MTYLHVSFEACLTVPAYKMSPRAADLRPAPPLVVPHLIVGDHFTELAEDQSAHWADHSHSPTSDAQLRGKACL